MRLVDVLLRRGHLSEDALTRAVLEGERPAHLDHCEICTVRAREIGRWLDEVRVAAVEATDEAFPAERLVAQQAQIFRRLTQLDEPARVLTFPVTAAKPAATTGRRVAPAWVGVAAAAGLIVGVVGGQAANYLQPGAPSRTAEAIDPIAAPESGGRSDLSTVPASILELELDHITPYELRYMDDITPRLSQIAQRY